MRESLSLSLYSIVVQSGVLVRLYIFLLTFNLACHLDGSTDGETSLWPASSVSDGPTLSDDRKDGESAGRNRKSGRRQTRYPFGSQPKTRTIPKERQRQKKSKAKDRPNEQKRKQTLRTEKEKQFLRCVCFVLSSTSRLRLSRQEDGRGQNICTTDFYRQNISFLLAKTSWLLFLHLLYIPIYSVL